MAKHSPRQPGEEDDRSDAPSTPMPVGLRRGPDGRVVLDEVAPPPLEAELDTVLDDEPIDPGEEQASRSHHPARRAMTAPGRWSRLRREDVEPVGGPIQPTPDIYFGRPPGTENRRAGAAALVGALLLCTSALVPWATRAPASLGATSFGWRDASGALGPAVLALVLGLVALGLAVAALAGRNDAWMRVADGGVGGAALVLALIEWRRIVDAAGRLDELTDGRGTLSPGWGLVLAAGGGVAMIVAAVVHRSTLPVWRQA